MWLQGKACFKVLVHDPIDLKATPYKIACAGFCAQPHLNIVEQIVATALQVSAHGVACKDRLVMMACKGRLVMKKNKLLACMGHVTRGGG